MPEVTDQVRTAAAERLCGSRHAAGNGQKFIPPGTAVKVLPSNDPSLF